MTYQHETSNISTTPAGTPQGEAGQGNLRRVPAHYTKAPARALDPMSRRIRDAVLEIERDRLDALYCIVFALARVIDYTNRAADEVTESARKAARLRAEEYPPCSYCRRSTCTGECLYD